MNKPSICLFAFALLLVASSCKKKDETPPYDPTAALAAVVKTISHTNTGTTETYTYTGDGKIQLIQSNAGNKTSFEYPDTATIIQTIFDNSGSIVSITNYVLEPFGFVSGSTVTNAGGNVLSTHRYYYDADKHIIVDNGSTANNDVYGKKEWSWGGGNLYAYAIYDSAVTRKDYDSYLWYYDPAVTSVGNANTGQKFFGADSKYLVRRIVGYTWGGGNNVYTYEYTFDSQQRITEARTYDYDGSLKNTDSYTYY